jgi:hypothetical protein
MLALEYFIRFMSPIHIALLESTEHLEKYQHTYPPHMSVPKFIEAFTALIVDVELVGLIYFRLSAFGVSSKLWMRTYTALRDMKNQVLYMQVFYEMTTEKYGDADVKTLGRCIDEMHAMFVSAIDMLALVPIRDVQDMLELVPEKIK